MSPHIEAEIELEKYFSPKLTPDRAHALAMLAYDDELLAAKFTSLAGKRLFGNK